MVLLNAKNIFIKTIISFELFFLIFLYLVCFNFNVAFSDNLSFNIKNVGGFSFIKKKFFFNDNMSVFFSINKNNIYKKGKSSTLKIYKLTDKFFVKGIVFNKNYLVIYTSNSLIVLDKDKEVILWKRIFVNDITLKPLIYSNFLFVNFGFDKIVSFNLLNGSIKWQFKDYTKDYDIYTNAKFLQSRRYLYYVYSNYKVSVINKDSGALIKDFSIHDNPKIELRQNLRISDIQLYNKIIYICYDNGHLLAFDSLEGDLLWKRIDLDCKKMVIYKNLIVIIRNNGYITLLNKFNGSKILDFINLKSFNPKKILILRKLNLVFVLGIKSLFVFRLTSNKVLLKNVIQLKTDDIRRRTPKSILLMSENRKIKEMFFFK